MESRLHVPQTGGKLPTGIKVRRLSLIFLANGLNRSTWCCRLCNDRVKYGGKRQITLPNKSQHVKIRRDRRSTPALPRVTEAVIDGAENENLVQVGPFPTVHPQIVAK